MNYISKDIINKNKFRKKKKNNNKVNKIKTNLRYFSRNWLQQNHSNKKLTKTVNTWSGHDASQ